jgi:hypothetical protein
MTFPIRDVDLIAYDQRGQALLLAIVKGSHDPSELWAAQYRRNLLAHGTLPAAPFFLIATLLEAMGKAHIELSTVQ